MCEFKFCKRKGKCFLAKVSPCLGVEDKKPKTSPKQPEAGIIRSLNLSYDGFLEPESLIDVLANAEVQTQAT